MMRLRHANMSCHMPCALTFTKERGRARPRSPKTDPQDFKDPWRARDREGKHNTVPKHTGWVGDAETTGHGPDHPCKVHTHCTPSPSTTPLASRCGLVRSGAAKPEGIGKKDDAPWSPILLGGPVSPRGPRG
jgi:hypothetical protein